MPQYKLTYFNGRGRAEVVRQTFALAGQDFEDYRLKEGEWATVKPTTPFGAVPILEIEGEGTLCQTLTIARYIARKYNVAGKTELEQARVDMIADCVVDMMSPMMAVMKAPAEEKPALKKKFGEEQLPPNLEKFEKLLAANKSGFFVGDEITWCDVYFVCAQGFLATMGIECCIEKYPNITAHKSKVESNEKIAAWMAKRPQTNF